VKVDRVEWITMPDVQTATSALQSGDIDFLERPSFDMLPILQADTNLTSRPLSSLGFQTIGRMNFLYPPFDNVKVRRAAMMALSQKDVLDAMVGDPKLYKICGAVFGCDTPLASDLGSDSLVNGNGMAEAKKLLAESGYDGTPVVILAATDVVTLKSQPIVAAQLLRQAGFQVVVRSMDWQTLTSVFVSQKPPTEGGWNMFFTNWGVADIMNPLANASLNSKGRTRGRVGWRDDPQMETLRDAFARAPSPEAQKKIATEIQARALDEVTYIPLGEFFATTAWRKELTGILDGPATPLFWNIDKSE
jgi:peptide/nickel transport system substrate-binding protein